MDSAREAQLSARLMELRASAVEAPDSVAHLPFDPYDGYWYTDEEGTVLGTGHCHSARMQTLAELAGKHEKTVLCWRVTQFGAVIVGDYTEF